MSAKDAEKMPDGYRFTAEWREKVIKAIVGRRIVGLSWDGEASVWILKLDDGQEFPILFAAEERIP